MEKDQEMKLLKQLGLSNHDAFNTLFLEYYPKVYNYLLGFIKDKDEANDFAQDIFVKIWIGRESVSKVNFFKAYLFSMVRNTIYNHFEHVLVRENYVSKIQELPLYSNLLESELYAKELSLMIDLAIEKMPEQRRKIFTMSRKEGFSNEEISIRLNISKRTVESHISLALSDLRGILTLFIAFVTLF